MKSPLRLFEIGDRFLRLPASLSFSLSGRETRISAFLVVPHFWAVLASHNLVTRINFSSSWRPSVCFLLGGERFYGRLNRCSVLSDVPAKATRVNRAQPGYKVIRLRRLSHTRQYGTDQAVFLRRAARLPPQGHP